VVRFGDHGCLLSGDGTVSGANVITALEVGKRDKNRVNVYLDGAFSFSLTLEEAVRLHKGQTLTEAEIAALRGQDDVKKAVDRAVRFLGYRPRSIQEVRRNLAQKKVEAAVIEAAVAKLIALGYLDDEAFARFWIQGHPDSSPKALRYKLRQMGVPDLILAEVLDTHDADDAAYRAAQTQTRRLRGKNRREFRDKLGAFLQRRGFPYSVCREMIRRLIDELESTDPAYFGEEGVDESFDAEPLAYDAGEETENDE